MNADETYMRRALRLAERGRGRVSPNPLVGAVIVRHEQIVGEGAHLRVGGPHAEINALEQAGARARDATVYVTLEPCSFHGRTPPCTDALIAAGIRRVVCAMVDPDLRVSGRGIQQLEEAGIQTETGLLNGAAENQNDAYVKHRREGLPLVILKLAQTLDGRIATRTGDARWITGEKARRHSHRWRSWVDAVAVGAGTVLADDPQLTVRHVRGPNPRPIVIDGRLRIDPQASLFRHPGALLITSTDVSAARCRPFTERGVEVWTYDAPDGHIDLRPPLARAATEGITSLIIEGGGQLAAAALRDQVVDRVHIYIAPRLMGTGIAGIADLDILEIDRTIALEQVRTRRLGDDLLYTACVRYPCSPD